MLSVPEVMARWRGVVAPLVTPFSEDGSPDLQALERNVGWLLDRGAGFGNSIFLVAGSGGDFSMMNLAERLAVIKLTGSVAGGRVPLIASAQSLDLRDTVALCQCAEESGFDAVQISGPFYYDGRPDDVTTWLARVAAETDVGFAIYNNWYTGYDMSLSLVDELLSLPNAVGLKWSSPSIETFITGVHRFKGRVSVINNTLVSVFGHMLGCHAFVSHWPNFYPEFPWALWDLLQARRFGEASDFFESVMNPYRDFVQQVSARTAGEAVFVRPFMEAAGLTGGPSPLPSRDEVVTASLRAGIGAILENAVRLTEDVRISLLSPLSETSVSA